MQTFLPYPCFVCTARVLDQRRLGKQRVEALQVHRALTVPGYAWRNHPAVRMWRGYREALVSYGLVICGAWVRRGHADTVAATLVADAGLRRVRSQRELEAVAGLPPWFGDPAVHRSHQSALVRKDPAYYRPYFPDVPDDLPYHWPVPKAG